jgi:hypothetical protein
MKKISGSKERIAGTGSRVRPPLPLAGALNPAHFECRELFSRERVTLCIRAPQFLRIRE